MCLLSSRASRAWSHDTEAFQKLQSRYQGQQGTGRRRPTGHRPSESEKQLYRLTSHPKRHMAQFTVTVRVRVSDLNVQASGGWANVTP
jgi:hypothetical protein